jgi:hypothetical protein
MKISETEQESTDFDWYAVDEEGFLAHFTSAGFKYLPVSVVADVEALQVLDDYFRCAAPRGGHKIAADLATRMHRDWKGEQLEGRYLQNFVAMANRGLHSFDIESYVKTGTGILCRCNTGETAGPWRATTVSQEFRISNGYERR